MKFYATKLHSWYTQCYHIDRSKIFGVPWVYASRSSSLLLRHQPRKALLQGLLDLLEPLLKTEERPARFYESDDSRNIYLPEAVSSLFVPETSVFGDKSTFAGEEVKRFDNRVSKRKGWEVSCKKAGRDMICHKIRTQGSWPDPAILIRDCKSWHASAIVNDSTFLIGYQNMT